MEKGKTSVAEYVEKKSDEENRTRISLDEDVVKKLKLIQSQLSQKTKEPVSFSQILNSTIRNSLQTKRQNFNKCPECEKEGFTVPMAEEEEFHVCFLCGFATKRLEDSVEKIIPIKEPVNDLRQREVEQTQQLLIALTNELYEKFEKIDSEKEKSNTENEKISGQSSQDQNPNDKEQPKTEFFTDISWYENKLKQNQNLQ